MTTSLYPVVTDALLAILSPLESVTVYDGWASTNDFNNNLMIGVSDPDGTSLQDSGVESQSWHGTGGPSGERDDNGDIWCTALAWNGGTGNTAVKAARDSVKAILAIVENQLRTNPTLSTALGSGLLWTEFGTQQNWKQGAGKNGVRCACSFTIHYRGLI